VVDPYECYFDAARGHYYLRGWCHSIDGHSKRRWSYYRLGRIIDLQVLPDKLPAVAPPARRYAVEYELSPIVARLGVSRQRGIDIQEVQRRPDGSVVVRGETESLFWAVQTLLHYGPTCRVLGGRELLREMRAVVHRMAALYDDIPPDVGEGLG